MDKPQSDHDDICELREQISRIRTEIEALKEGLDHVRSSSVTQREHDLLDDKVDLSVLQFHTELEKAEQNRKDALDRAALTIQTGLDKAEKTLQVALDKAERNLQVGLEAAEKRVNEKLTMQKEIMDKSEVQLSKIVEERALYITRDQLDLIRQTIQGDIKPLERRDAGMAATFATANWIWYALLALAGMVLEYVALRGK